MFQLVKGATLFLGHSTFVPLSLKFSIGYFVRFNSFRRICEIINSNGRLVHSKGAKLIMAENINGQIQAAISKGNEEHKKQHNIYIGYGTAGFRTIADRLDHVMFRTGIVAALRSLEQRGTIGVIITASHNPEEDNGVKVVDTQGEMLHADWEKLVTEIANASDDEMMKLIGNLVANFGISFDNPCSVYIGRDTRKSSLQLTNAVIDGVRCISPNAVEDFGIVSTPMVSYLVHCWNSAGFYGVATTEGYYNKLSEAYKKIVGNSSSKQKYKPFLLLDGANGVGSIVIKEIGKLIGDEILKITLHNGGPPGILNYNCGADFVKVSQCAPVKFPNNPGARCATLDGDADRLIYFYHDKDSKFRMLDGDKIALLYVDHLSDLAKRAGLTFKLGVVQTAYANGSSTNYIEKILGMPVTCVPTGVKHLHHAALAFDVGVYFEANGHGTVVFSKKAVDEINENSSESGKEFQAFVNLINSCVGDAVSDLLVAEAILHSKDWSIEDWDNMYDDLPNRQLKVCVSDRKVISTTDAERKCVTPDGLQAKIEALASQFTNGRSFVRPSGTEDIVRVYAEADTQENADKLAKEVAVAVYELAGGVGKRPDA